MAELRVKEIINQRGISVREFAQMIGVTREYCYSLLKGEHASQKIVETMGRALNLPIRDLYTKPNEIESIYNPYEIVFGRTEHYKSNDIVTFGNYLYTFSKSNFDCYFKPYSQTDWSTGGRIFGFYPREGKFIFHRTG